MHLGKEFADTLSEFGILLRRVWRGKEEDKMMLPCPFCGGVCYPDGWMAQGGASGPACRECGATAWTIDIWNTRVELPAELRK